MNKLKSVGLIWVTFLLAITVITDLKAQTLTDGPIVLEVRMREVGTFFDATDGVAGLFDPDELTYKIWARDNADIDGQSWRGGACLTQNFAPVASGTNSMDFNYLMFSETYATNLVPEFFDLRLDAWEDESGNDQVLGIGCGGNRCDFETNLCCGGEVLGVCVGFRTDDDFRCDAEPFRLNMDYRQGAPCETYDWGQVTLGPGATCATNVYRPHIESFWRYTSGTSCANRLSAGTYSGSASLQSYFNSNSCYTNNWVNSPGPDVFYEIDVTVPTGITISVCDANFDSYLYLLDNTCSNIIASNNDALGNCPGNSQASYIQTTICTPGTYTIVVDGNTAVSAGNFTLTIENDPSVVLSVTGALVNDVSCPGGSDGSATVTIDAGTGTAPFTYVWSDGQTTQTAINLPAGLNGVTVTDATGCIATASITVSQPPPFNTVANGVSPTCNGGSDGSVTVNVTGGTPPYQYSIDTANTFQFNGVFAGLTAGDYIVIIEDANGCRDTSSVVTLTNPPASIVPNLVITDVSCNGLADGFAISTPTNGNPPYLFSWNGLPFTATNQSPPFPIGTYPLVIQDVLGCELATSFTIGQPAPLTALISATVDVTCNGASDGGFTVSALGGTTPYQYSTDNISFQPSATFTGLPAGIYNVYVEDANGCSEIISVTVVEPPVLFANVLFKIEPTCTGNFDGLVVISAVGGTLPYEFSDDNVSYQTSGAFINLPGGTYTFYVRDANGCVDSISETLIDPAPLVMTPTITDATCLGISDGQIQVAGAGGNPPYTYSIDGGAFFADSVFTGLDAGTYDITIKDANFCESTQTFTVGTVLSITATVTAVVDVACNGDSTGSITASASGGTAPYTFSVNGGAVQSSGTFSNLPAGSYDITVQDAGGCLAFVTATVTEPTVLVVDLLSVTDASCFNLANGAIDIDVSGGTAPYTYLWSDGATSQDLSGIFGGPYTVTVTDDNGCTETLTVDVDQTPAMFVNIASSANVSCGGAADGAIDITVNGGTPPYTFAWDDGETKEDRDNLSGGLYQVTITDANGCAIDTSANLTESAPVVITATSSGTVTCEGGMEGSITVSASGGDGGYEYTIDGFSFQSDATIDSLGAGSYVIQARDGSGCVSNTVAIVIDDVAGFIVEYMDQEITLGDTVRLTPNLSPSGITLTGATWSPVDGLSCTTCVDPVASPEETTFYTVSVTDANGCVETTTVTVEVNDDFRVVIPNIFSPNGDGINDDFRFYSFGAVETNVQIFNRWGALVYLNPNQASAAPGWDGTFKGEPSQESTYIYVIDVVYENDVEEQFTGSITLIR